MSMDMNGIAPLLPIVIDGHTFKPNVKGLWSLTEINKTLPNLTKAPAQWRGRDRDYFDQCANLHSENGGTNPGTYATERATIAYAMSCSLDFYVMVVDAFVAMRNNAVRELRSAHAQIDAMLPKATVLEKKAEGHGITWFEACQVVGIRHPQLALDALVRMGVFTTHSPEFGMSSVKPRPKPQAFKVGAFVKVTTDYGNSEGWRVKTRGLDGLVKYVEEVNRVVTETRAKKLRARRVLGKRRGI